MMTPEEIKELKKGIAITASFYGRDLLPEAIQMMADDLADLPFADVSRAYFTYRRDPKNRAMPLPAQIRAIVDPVPDAEAEGREAVELIKVAIRDFGYTQGEAAKEFMGPVAWAIVQGAGGWMSICQSDFIHNPGLIAQARKRAEDLINYGEVKLRANLNALPPVDNVIQIESKKHQAVEEFKKHQAEQNRAIEKWEVPFEIPSDEDRARMIQELLNKAKEKQL